VQLVSFASFDNMSDKSITSALGKSGLATKLTSFSYNRPLDNKIGASAIEYFNELIQEGFDLKVSKISG
jgi:hypothetical protein